MATQLNYQAESFLARQDMTAGSSLFVTLDSTGYVGLPLDATKRAEGILENTPLYQQPATVSYLGVTKVQVDAAYPIGQLLKPQINTGLGTADDGTAFPNNIRAVMLEPSTDSTQVVMVRLLDI